MSTAAADLLRGISGALIPVPAVQPGVCKCCRSSCGPGFAYCRQCDRARQSMALPDVLPIAMAVKGEHFDHALNQYKRSPDMTVRKRFTMQLAALLATFVNNHHRCLGTWDLIATVGSPDRDAPASIVARIPALRAQHLPVLTPLRRNTDREIDPDRFRVDPEVRGRSVLVIDDTFVSGASTFSAVGALQRAGATVIGPLVLGRHVAPAWPPSAELLQWLRNYPWDAARCGRCDGVLQPGNEGHLDFW